MMSAFSSFWCGCLALSLVVRFTAFEVVTCNAVEPPTVAEFRSDSTELRKASSKVQGEIRVFRSETVIPAALEQLPTEIGLPLIRNGYVWRSGKKVRYDYRAYHPQNESAKEFQHSVAVDGGKVYGFSSGIGTALSMLRVYDMDTPEATNAMPFIESAVYWPIDALWSAHGTAFVDMLQRPGAQLVPNKSQVLRGGYSIILSAGGGSKSQLEFAAGKNHPFGYLLTFDGQGRSRVIVQRRVYCTETQGLLLPTRVVDVASLGRGGYTEVVMLDLIPLQPDSPIATTIISASFRNLGSNYQVYKFRKGEKEELAEQYSAQ